VRNLADAVVRAANGPLQDDATIVILDWLGPDQLRQSEGDASLDYRSPPHEPSR
jgi:hypothetical protein